jgi:phosphate transport system substrate-binding protein
MEGQKLDPAVEYVNTNPQAQGRVKTTPGAIGYVGLGFIDQTVKALEIDGIEPNRRTVAAGKYPISRPLFMFTNGYPDLGSHVYRFVTMYLTEEGQDIIEAKGFVPLTNY